MVDDNFECLTTEQIFPYLHRGGTILQTDNLSESQNQSLPQQVITALTTNDFDALIVIGNQESYQVAAKITQLSFPVVTIPATIVNDISGTKRSLGFATAVNNAVNAIDKLHTTAESHGHIFVVEVMGKKVGHIAKYVGKAIGADMILIPETKVTVEQVIEKLNRNKRKEKSYSMIVTAEGAITCDDLAKEIEARSEHKIHPLALGYIQRGGDAVYEDRILGVAFGEAAINILGSKKHGIALGMNFGEIEHLPLLAYL
ncbi:6-phosphofructokinase [Lactococcus laudensis]|uniref:6-phosphofructokinase n=1 Tax=Pseudolactococcus laudensis TaxID=1494461 RepID=UPI002FCAFCD8